jgi:hypothetical protein
MNDNGKFVVTLTAGVVMAIVAAVQLALFVTLRSSPTGILDFQGGSYHLWLAVSAATVGLIEAALMFFFFLRRDRNRWPKMPLTTRGRVLAQTNNKLMANPQTPVISDAVQWAQLNPWLLEGQADDRLPTLSNDAGGSPATIRSIVRRSHQLSYKEWSKARHD